MGDFNGDGFDDLRSALPGTTRAESTTPALST
jgi:hypothetical protein